MSELPEGWDRCRVVTTLRNQRTAKGVRSLTRCTSCGFTTEDEQERREHYPRYLLGLITHPPARGTPST
jgi:hypothetical protein